MGCTSDGDGVMGLVMVMPHAMNMHMVTYDGGQRKEPTDDMVMHVPVMMMLLTMLPQPMAEEVAVRPRGGRNSRG